MARVSVWAVAHISHGTYLPSLGDHLGSLAGCTGLVTAGVGYIRIGFAKAGPPRPLSSASRVGVPDYGAGLVENPPLAPRAVRCGEGVLRAVVMPVVSPGRLQITSWRRMPKPKACNLSLSSTGL